MHEWGATAGTASLAVLAVHGRGQTPQFMQETAGRFAAAQVRFHAPHASGDSWYPEPFLAPLERNRPALDRSLEVVTGCLDELAGRGFPRDRVVLWGFSQGACLLAHHVLTVAPQRYGGLILFTGGCIGPKPVTAPPAGALDGLDTVVRSIDRDPWVPRYRVEQTAELLERAGASVDLRIDPGNEHVITDEACGAAGALLAAAG
ncbi:alpha/beta hydrolase [Pseudonocardia parietis]|nr:phospholipase [Pseudonocardia parietis]